MKKSKGSASQFFLFAIILAATVVGIFYTRQPVFKKMQKGERINFLFVGCDEVEGGSHADAILWLSLEPKTNFVDVVSIPRDTLVRWERGWIPRKMSEVLYLETKKNGMDVGMENFIREVSDFLGIHFDYYLTLSFSIFADLIDLIGGIPVEIREPMHYDDFAGNLHIHFDPGKYVLNGEDALKFVRFRATPLGDIGRIRRQQDFIEKVVAGFASFRFLFSLPDFLKIYRKNVYTNIKIAEFFPLLEKFRSIQPGNQRFQILPGQSQEIVSKNVWRLDKELFEEVKAAVFSSEKELYPRSKIRPFVVKKKKGILEGIRAEVFNATGRSGLAQDLTEKLRQLNCDVVYWGNWGARRDKTEVIARSSDFSAALRLAAVLGCSRVRADIDPERMADVSVVIGEDYPQ